MHAHGPQLGRHQRLHRQFFLPLRNCTNVPATCGKADTCTSNTRGAYSGWQHTAIKNRCRDGVGESGDDCEIYCGSVPFTVTTNICIRCSVKSGIFFDVVAKKKLVLRTQTVRVYCAGNLHIWTQGSPTKATNKTRMAGHR